METGHGNTPAVNFYLNFGFKKDSVFMTDVYIEKDLIYTTPSPLHNHPPPQPPLSQQFPHIPFHFPLTPKTHHLYLLNSKFIFIFSLNFIIISFPFKLLSKNFIFNFSLPPTHNKFYQYIILYVFFFFHLYPSFPSNSSLPLKVFFIRILIQLSSPILI